MQISYNQNRTFKSVEKSEKLLKSYFQYACTLEIFGKLRIGAPYILLMIFNKFSNIKLLIVENLLLFK